MIIMLRTWLVSLRDLLLSLSFFRLSITCVSLRSSDRLSCCVVLASHSRLCSRQSPSLSYYIMIRRDLLFQLMHSFYYSSWRMHCCRYFTWHWRGAVAATPCIPSRNACQACSCAS